ncbi:hypothetical protein [Nostoc sp.]|uniref:hypothetical protein n=1 Tax=Nostoc sp. TaxID=1180 RepID=UPI002FF6A015
MTITVSEQAYNELFQEAEETTTYLTARDQSNQWDSIALFSHDLLSLILIYSQ